LHEVGYERKQRRIRKYDRKETYWG
jgi:hypothetical protein